MEVPNFQKLQHPVKIADDLFYFIFYFYFYFFAYHPFFKQLTIA